MSNSRFDKLRANSVSEVAPTDVQSPEMARHYANVDEVKAATATIRHNITALSEVNQKLVQAVAKDQQKQLQGEYSRIQGETSAVINATKKRLAEMAKENDAFDKREENAGSPEIRIRRTTTVTCANKFVEVAQEFSNLQHTVKDKQQDKIGRQYMIVHPEATPAEVDAFVGGGTDQAVFSLQTKDLKVNEALEGIRQKAQAIKELEESITQLNQLFIDMATLVEMQDSMINSIEFNVNQAEAAVEHGVRELNQAGKLQKKNRKRMWCLAVIFLVALAIILGVTIPKPK
jgi:t-SNARE complex subunit (syntaxin)